MLVLDTDVLTLIQIGKGDAYRRLAERLEAGAAGQEICVTIISFEEQMRGWLAQIAKVRGDKQTAAYARLHNLRLDYCPRRILDFDAAAREHYQSLAKSKIRIGTMGLKIAAIALANNAVLLSRNLRDFGKVPALRVEDWTTGNAP
jgi:tRNA(fMet)-specific endonuclease VapC